MVRINILMSILIASISMYSQELDSTTNQYSNSVDNLLKANSKLVIGGYGEVHYNQPVLNNVRQNGKMDVHRIVMLFGYHFNKRTQFITELEFEHVKEVYVEQTFLQYKLSNYINVRGGLLLIPVGIINEYHEPTTFNGVERPLIDKYIVPTTWREIGLGFSGNIIPASIKYQLYLVNGLNGYDNGGLINGSSIRKGRQKGAESYISSPNFTGKIEYYAVRGLNLGLSGYYGKTQSTLYDNADRNQVLRADSSVLGIALIGFDNRYNYKGFQFKGQLYYGKISNTKKYNEFTAINDTTLNDVGNAITGFYAEIGYNILRSYKTEKELIPFIRYEFFDTHLEVNNNILKNPSYSNSVITAGISLKLTSNSVIKADIQLLKNGNDNNFSKTINIGIGVMF